MAAPFIAGQAALIRKLEPDLKPETSQANPGQRSVESVIENNARSLKATNPDYDGKLGAGHADVYASLQELRPDAECNAPTISGVRPASGATVKDRETDLTASDIGMTLDGRAITNFEYDAGALTFDRTGKLSYGRHSVELTAEDADGLDTTRSWRFKVVRR